ncbi:MAG TPA: prephenate dehydrogenase/arogenate dehydrogenase family protein [Solirubrobacteraceae bacterium]|nr:prephenate dehydrogenase/arogenate dehydrogenase family protein [Solirubrobacteraceae bacterium]
MRLAVLGVGLIGGSIGLAARRRTGAYVVGYDSEASALSSAVELGAIDESAFAISDAVREADVVFIATPVGTATDIALLALETAGSECALSDVGSTKRAIVGAISDPRFVGGHPLAGAETAGVASAREDLFEGATWYLTPAAGAAWSAAGAGSPSAASEEPEEGAASAEARAAPSVDAAPWAVERLRGFIERVGGQPAAIAPDAHDRLMASVSHLPHVLANVLVAQAVQSIESHGAILDPEVPLGSGPSFRDATRVAGANTAIWTDIYLSNRDLLVEALDGAIDELSAVRDTLRTGDAQRLAAWNERARAELARLRRAGLVSGS